MHQHRRSYPIVGEAEEDADAAHARLHQEVVHRDEEALVVDAGRRLQRALALRAGAYTRSVFQPNESTSLWDRLVGVSGRLSVTNTAQVELTRGRV